MVLANITTSSTFYEWMTRTNQIIVKLDEVVGNTNNAMANTRDAVNTSMALSFANNSSYVNTSVIQLTANVANSVNYVNSLNSLPLAGGTMTGNVYFVGTNLVIDLLG